MVKKSPATGKPMKPLEITIPAETQNETNPEVTTHETPSGETYTTPKLKVPEKKPQPPVQRLTKEEAEKWAGVHYAERDPEEVEMFNTLRGMIEAIPTPTRDDGSVVGGFSAFALIKDVLGGSLNLMEAPSIGVVQPEWIMQQALDMAPTSGVAGAVTMPKGAFGMFGSRPGPQASPEIHQRYADLIKTAKRMDQDMLTPEEIHKQTGMSKDHAGSWVYEVPNDDVRINVHKLSELNDIHEAAISGDPGVKGSIIASLDEVVDLPDVYAHWPELKDVFIMVDNTTDHVASYNPSSNTIAINLDKVYGAGAADDADVKTIVHEIQHALQWMQGRKGGSSPEKSNDWMEKSMEVVKKAADRALKIQGTFTPAQNNALMRTQRLIAAWRKMSEVWGEKRAAYKMDPGEIEAELSESLVSNPGLIKMHPDNDTRRALAGVPMREFQMQPDEINFPAPDPNDKLNITKGKMSGGKTFGKKGTEPQLSDGGDPDWTGVPLGPGTRRSVERAQQRMDETQARLKQSRLAYGRLNEELGKLLPQEGASLEIDAKIAGIRNNMKLIGNQMDLEERIIKGDEDLIGTFIDENVDASVRALTAIDSPDLQHLNKADRGLVLEFGSQQQRNYEGIHKAREQIRSLQNKVEEAKSQAIRNELSDMIEDRLDSIERRMERISQNDEYIQRILDRVNQRSDDAQAPDNRRGPPKEPPVDIN